MSPKEQQNHEVLNPPSYEGVPSETRAVASNPGLKYLSRLLSVEAKILRDHAMKLDELSLALISGIDEIDASLISRFEGTMAKLWEIPIDYPGAWPPVVAPRDFARQIARREVMASREQTLEWFISFALRSSLSFFGSSVNTLRSLAFSCQLRGTCQNAGAFPLLMRLAMAGQSVSLGPS